MAASRSIPTNAAVSPEGPCLRVGGPGEDLGELAAVIDHSTHLLPQQGPITVFIHHNTLHYRLQRVSALTGRPIDSVASRVDLALALAIPRSPAAVSAP